MNIGVFDSGRGGEFIAEGLKKLLPEHEYIVVNDREHVPYGSRTTGEVTALTDSAIQPLLDASCEIIVIACNTATMAAITTLRATYPATKFVGIEPMLKPAAAMSQTAHIAVLATPLTLQSKRYRQLVADYTNGVKVSEPNTAGWATAIEHNTPSQISFVELQELITAGCDILVLACTHYLALHSLLAHEFPHVQVLEPTEAIARQVVLLALE